MVAAFSAAKGQTLLSRSGAWALGPALGAGVLVGAASGFVLLDDLRTTDEVAIIAHRGASGSRPENTLAAVRKAIADGADWIEIDVQETADGEVVVIHDSDFMRIAGVDLKVRNATMADLAAIDVGSWFSPDYAGERTPTLAAVLAAAKGRARVLIELKSYGDEGRLEERVVRIVEDHGMADHVAIMSFRSAMLRKTKELRPHWPVGLLAATAIGDLGQLEADFVAVSAGMATPDFVRRAREMNRDVYVWTVNSPLPMSRMISRGATGLITDEPALAQQVLSDRAALSTPERLLLQVADLFDLRMTTASRGSADR